VRRPAGTHPIYWRSFPYSPPDDWELTAISDLCDRVKGKLATDLSEKRSETSRRYLLTGQLNCVEEPCYTCQADIPDVKPTDTVMAVDGTVGAVFTGLSGALGSTMMRFRPRDLVDHEFIYYLLHSLEAYSSATAIVGAVPHLDKRLLSQLVLKTPGQAERAIIGRVLRAVDEMLSATNNELLAAQRLKTALMQQLFTKGIPGRHKTFKTVRVGRIHFSIPEEWEMATLASHCGGHDCVKTGPFGAQLPIEVFRPTGIRIINITDIGEGRIVFSTEAYVDDEVADRLRDYRLKKGDIIFSRVASVGRLGLITEEYDGFLMSSNCIRLRPNSKFNSIFLLHTFLDSQAVSRQVVAAATGGARPIVTPRFLRRMTIPKPLIAEQNEIADIIEKTSQLVDSIESKINALEVLKKSLLQNLLTGKVRVNMEARV